MEIVILPDNATIGRLGADAVGNLLQRKPAAVLGLATGSSPLSIYDELATRSADGSVSFAQASGFTLDEYVGLPADHPESYRNVIDKDFVSRVDFASGAIQGPDGLAEDIPAACAAYEATIRDLGGVDLQILGIGANGHIGFNEPTSSFASRTRIKTLAPRTRFDNARFFTDPGEVPTHCLTQGLGTIMGARELLLVAQGEGKAGAIAAAVEGPVSSMCPGSILQFHQHATVIIDDAANYDGMRVDSAGRLWCGGLHSAIQQPGGDGFNRARPRRGGVQPPPED